MFFYRKFYSQKGEWDWAAGLYKPSTYSKIKVIHTISMNLININYINSIEKKRKTGKKKGKITALYRCGNIDKVTYIHTYSVK